MKAAGARLPRPGSQGHRGGAAARIRLARVASNPFALALRVAIYCCARNRCPRASRSRQECSLFSIEELERVTGLPVEVTDDEVIRNPPSLRTSQKTTRGNDFLDQMRESWANYVARNHSIPTSSQLIQQLERDSITNDSIIVDRDNRTISICDKKKDFGKSDFGFEQSYRRLKRELSDQ